MPTSSRPWQTRSSWAAAKAARLAPSGREGDVVTIFQNPDIFHGGTSKAILLMAVQLIAGLMDPCLGATATAISRHAQPNPQPTAGGADLSTLEIVGSGAGIFPGSSWIWSPANVSRANAQYALFDVWGAACHQPPQCGAPWNCSDFGAKGCLQQPSAPGIGEWGYQYANMECASGAVFAACCNQTSASYKSPPETRAIALQRMQRYFICRQADAATAETAATGNPAPAGFSALNGHYLYFHHAVNFGHAGDRPVTFLSSEVAENINSVNGHLAFLRGAARQYDVASWGVDVSPWFRGFVPDFANGSHPWAAHASSAGPHGGHSVSLLRRIYFALAAAGAHQLAAESADNYAFVPTVDHATGVYELSPFGEMIQEFSHLPRQWGQSYTPLAVLFQATHGMGLGWWYQSLSFETMARDGFQLSEGEQVATYLFELLWPESWRGQWGESGSWREAGESTEQGQMVASPYGEVIDVLSPKNLSDTALQRYSTVVLAGDVEVDDMIEERVLHSYVHNGGSILMFSKQAVESSKLQALLAGAGVRLGSKQRVHVEGARAPDGSWSTPSLTSPKICAPIFGASGVVWTGTFYIKVGGDRSKIRGWDNGVLDRCCVADVATSHLQESAGRTGAQRCLVFNSASSCEAALQSVNCTACSGDEADDSLGCPQWRDSAHVEITTHSELGNVNNTSVLAEFTNMGGTAVPAVIESPLGQGRIVVFLVDDVPTLQVRHTLGNTCARRARAHTEFTLPTQSGPFASAQAYGLLHRTLQSIVDAHSPFELVDPTSGEDLRPRVPPPLSQSCHPATHPAVTRESFVHRCRCSSCSTTGQSLCLVGRTSMLPCSTTRASERLRPSLSRRYVTLCCKGHFWWRSQIADKFAHCAGYFSSGVCVAPRQGRTVAHWRGIPSSSPRPRSRCAAGRRFCASAYPGR